MSDQTIVHLLRHGEVHNPTGVLYGRLPDFHLSGRGQAMAKRVAEVIGDRDIVHVRCSPLERVQETAAPLIETLRRNGREVDVHTDARVIESGNAFQGMSFADGAMTLIKRPHLWPKLRNPFRPSWGEPYVEIAARMLAAVYDARDAARGHEAVIVSHQLPIWITRLNIENKNYLHSPQSRQCTICSLTSLHFTGDEITQLSYSEPAGDLIPVGDKNAAFSSGGAEEQ